MTHKEHAMRVIQGKHIDSIPFFPRIDLWYNAQKKTNTLPEEFKGLSLWDIYRKLGVGISGRSAPFFKEVIHNVEVITHQNGKETTYEYRTPKGIVSTKYALSKSTEDFSIRPLQREFMIKKEADYEVANYIVENTEILPAYDKLLEYQNLVGDDGIVFALAGYCPMHKLMIHYLGYENFFYEYMDNRSKIESLLEVLQDKADSLLKIAQNSSAEMVRFGGNYTDFITTPPIFEKYFLPSLCKFADGLHSCGKLMVSHTDGEMKQLLPLIKESGLDIAEAIAPAPLTNITITEIRKAWKDEVVIWGGIPSNVLSSYFPKEKFYIWVEDFLAEIKDDQRIIVSMGDNTPTDADFDRIYYLLDVFKET